MRNVPKLRFKEFTDEWEEKRLGEISNIKGGYAFKSQNFLNNKSKYQVIKMGNIYKNKLLLDKSPSYLDEISEKEKDYLLEKDDIILTLTGTVGKRDFGYSCQIKEEKNLLLNQRLACIKSKKEIINRKFLRYIISHQNFLDIFFEISMGGTGNQANVSIKDICDIIVKIGENKEQQKIADFLSSVDIKISITEEKLNLFNEYKKGIMQKIFNQELKFKDENGNDYPEWEEKELKELLESIIDNRGKTPPNLENNTLIPLLEINSIGERKIRYEKVTKFVTEETYDTWFRNHIIKDDILFSTVGATALCSMYRDEKKSVIAQNLVGLRIKKNYVPDYIYSLIIETKNNLKFKSIEMVAVQPSIKVSQMINLKFKVSTSYEEQQKIADFLSAIDTKIERISDELENLKEFKKGLLQQMFV